MQLATNFVYFTVHKLEGNNIIIHDHFSLSTWFIAVYCHCTFCMTSNNFFLIYPIKSYCQSSEWIKLCSNFLFRNKRPLSVVSLLIIYIYLCIGYQYADNMTVSTYLLHITIGSSKYIYILKSVQDLSFRLCIQT